MAVCQSINPGDGEKMEEGAVMRTSLVCESAQKEPNVRAHMILNLTEITRHGYDKRGAVIGWRNRTSAN
jgi:hypothetical protein